MGGRVCAQEVAARTSTPKDSRARIAVIRLEFVMEVLLGEFSGLRLDDGQRLRDTFACQTGNPTACSDNVPKRLLKKSKPQIPHRLKSVRDDKYKRLMTAYLKVRPFKCGRKRVFSSPLWLVRLASGLCRSCESAQYDNCTGRCHGSVFQQHNPARD